LPRKQRAHIVSAVAITNTVGCCMCQGKQRADTSFGVCSGGVWGVWCGQ